MITHLLLEIKEEKVHVSMYMYMYVMMNACHVCIHKHVYTARKYYMYAVVHAVFCRECALYVRLSWLYMHNHIAYQPTIPVCDYPAESGLLLLSR